MIKRLFIVLVLALVTITNAYGIASAAAIPDQLRVGLWPEYDDSQVLIMERVEYPADAPLPIEVKMAVPKGATIRWTGEIMSSDASQDIRTTPKVNKKADYDEIVFTLTKGRTAQLEAKWSGLKVKGKDRSIVLEWTQRYNAKETIFEFRKPSQISELKLSEPFGQTNDSAKDPDFSETAPLNLAVGQKANINITYKRSTNKPTVTEEQGQQQQPSASQGPGTKSNNLTLILIALVVGVTAFIAYTLVRKKSDEDEGDVQSKKSARLTKAGRVKPQLIVLFVFAGILIAVIANTARTSSPIPPGNNCEQNKAYLQDGVDAYKEAHGVFPTELGQLLESKDGKGPFVETISLTCPTEGSPYIVIDGVIQQGPK